MRHFPSTGARIGHAVALGETGDVAAGLAALSDIDAAAIKQHQPWWISQAHLLRLAGRAEEAAIARQRAIGLTEDARIRAWLIRGANDGG